MARTNKKEQEKAALKERADKLIAEMREVFAAIDDYERQDLHSKLMEGYCPTCAHKIDGYQCWNCFESGCDI
jgi:hypothetical protein